MNNHLILPHTYSLTPWGPWAAQKLLFVHICPWELSVTWRLLSSQQKLQIGVGNQETKIQKNSFANKEEKVIIKIHIDPIFLYMYHSSIYLGIFFIQWESFNNHLSNFITYSGSLLFVGVTYLDPPANKKTPRIMDPPQFFYIFRLWCLQASLLLRQVLWE